MIWVANRGREVELALMTHVLTNVMKSIIEAAWCENWIGKGKTEAARSGFET